MLYPRGGRFFLYGLFKKIVVADNISGYVDAVFNNLDKHSLPLILAGYSLVSNLLRLLWFRYAIGLSKL